MRTLVTLFIFIVSTKSGLSGSEVDSTETKVWYVYLLCFYFYPDKLSINSVIKGVTANVSIWGTCSHKKNRRVETFTAVLNVFICFMELDSGYLRYFPRLIWVRLEGS